MLIYIIPLILGWAAGTLVNYLADVLPWKRKLTRPFCTHCQSTFPWIFYLFWPKRCSTCGKMRTWRTWLVEIFFIICAVLLWHRPVEMLGFWASLVLLAYFGVVVVIDMEYKLILHPISIFGAVLGAVIGIYLHGWKTTLLGGIAGYGIMFALYALGAGWLWLVNRKRGQKVDDVALGYGDVNLSGILGLILGWPGIIVGLTLAILIGGIVSLVYLLVMVISRKYELFSAIPYGPFLIAGTVLLIFFRDTLQSLFNR
jgi:leader peptidase (prepilin peptidase)/N-methyltransferase